MPLFLVTAWAPLAARLQSRRLPRLFRQRGAGRDSLRLLVVRWAAQAAQDQTAQSIQQVARVVQSTPSTHAARRVVGLLGRRMERAQTAALLLAEPTVTLLAGLDLRAMAVRLVGRTMTSEPVAAIAAWVVPVKPHQQAAVVQSGVRQARPLASAR